MEELMQYVWAYRLWDGSGQLYTVDGQPVSIIDPGQWNRDAGPDFFNAKAIIDGRMWVGNIELHVAASDWYKHHHDTNPAYDSIILHVVNDCDVIVCRNNGEEIPHLVLNCNPDLSSKYNLLTAGSPEYLTPCSGFIPQIPTVYMTDWLQRLGMERLHNKVERIRTLVKASNGDFDQAAFITLARAMGSGINGDSFQALAASIPLNILRKNITSPVAVEALLFGQAGMLDATQPEESYHANLRAEYEFLKHKYGLNCSQAINWRMSRMRPPNMPHRRIALLATVLKATPFITTTLIGINSIDDARKHLSLPPAGFWAQHYTFNSPVQTIMPQVLSVGTLNTIIINAVIPLKYAIGIEHGDHQLCEAAVEMLTELPRENNRIVNMFCDFGINCPDAFTSQALIQLRNEYCTSRKCLFCRIGHRWLSSQAILHIGRPIAVNE